MTKKEFLEELRSRLQGLPQEDLQKSLDYYEELLNDYIEDGKTEEDAVASLGDMEEIISQILGDVPLGRLVGEKFKPRRKLQTWEIVLLILGFPLWFSLLTAVFSVVLVVYLLIWSVAIVVWLVDFAFAAVGVVSVPATLIMIFTGRALAAVFMLGCGLFLAGLAILLFFAGKIVTKYILKGTKKAILGTKRSIVKGGAQ